MEINYFFLFLDEANDLLSGWEKSCLDLEQSNDREAAESLYRTAHNLKSGSAAVNLMAFRNFVHRVEDFISKFLSGEIPNSPQLIKILLNTQTVLTEWITKVRDDVSFVPAEGQAKVEAEITAALSEKAETPRIGATEAVAPVVQEAPVVPVTMVPELTAPTVPVETNDQTKNHTATRSSETLRVAASKLDMLIQLAGELSTQQAIVWHARQHATLNSKSCDNAIQLVQKGAKDLQGLALSLRMQTLQTLFQRLERTSRDLARTQEKKIDIILKGDDVEIDRAVVDRIADALMHVVRNAVDHGIEKPQDRLDQGKKDKATLTFEGLQQPNGISITIIDDGRGLNTERILKKAIEKGLADPNKKYELHEIQRFIFAHGFSTAEAVTNVSGRGVGMDVVKSTVEDIGGDIVLESTFGKGTKFTISLPTTLSIMDALIVKIGHTPYAVPVQDIDEIIDLSSYHVESGPTHKKLLSLRRQVIPLENLADHLPHARESARDTTNEFVNSLRPALLVTSGRRSLGFEVDAILGQQRVSLQKLPSVLDDVNGFAGGTVLGDGEPCVILNLLSLLREHYSSLTEGVSAQHEVTGFAELMEDSVSSFTDRYLIFKLQSQLLGTPITHVREIISPMASQSLVQRREHISGYIDLRGEALAVVHLPQYLGVSSKECDGPVVIADISGQAYAFRVDGVEGVADLVCESRAVSPLGDKSSGIARFNGNLISLISLEEIFTKFQGVDFVAQVNASVQEAV